MHQCISYRRFGQSGGNQSGRILVRRRRLSQTSVRRDPSAVQPAPQALPAGRQPAADRPDRAAEPFGGLLVCQTLQVAEHDRVRDTVREADRPPGGRRRGRRPHPLHDLGASARRPWFVQPPACHGVPVRTTQSEGPRRGATGRSSHEPTPKPLCARTRNVAWNASCAACSSRRTFRQTRRTIGPCRSTSAGKARSADSRPLLAYRSSNSASESVETVPSPSRESTLRRTLPQRRFHHALILSGRPCLCE